jgi:hypothetical protein
MKGTGKSYDAFISYSHAADGRLAPAVQRGLERFGRPWHRVRALNVFRDVSGLGVTEALWPRIQDAIRRSRHFLLLASPQAADSRWVVREIGERKRSNDSILIVLTQGDIVWDDERGDFDWKRTNALPPVLGRHFKHEPLHLDLRWAASRDDLSLSHPRFRDAIASLGAAIRGVD